MYKLKLIPFRLSLLFFGIPTAIGVVGLYIVLPALDRAGLPLLWNYTLSFAGMFPLLLGIALVAYRIEGHKFSWQDLKRRFRIKGLNKKGWSGTVGIVTYPITEQPGHVLVHKDGSIFGMDASFEDVKLADESTEGFAQLGYHFIKLGSQVIEQKLIVYRK